MTEETGAQVSSATAGLWLAVSTGSGAVEQEVAFACVARERCGASELRLGFGEAAELEKKVTADTGQKVIGLERRLVDQRVDDLETCCRTERQGDRDRTIQLHDG